MHDWKGGRLAVPKLTPTAVPLRVRLTFGGGHHALPIPREQGSEALTGEDR
jgi:hypothetical protein